MIPTIMVKYLIRIAFLLFCFFFPVNPQKVTFASYRSEKLEGNLLYMYKEMESRGGHFEFGFLFKKVNGSILGKLN